MPKPPPPFLVKLFFSNHYSYAQVLRKADGHIVASASTIEKELRTTLDNRADKAVSAPFRWWFRAKISRSAGLGNGHSALDEQNIVSTKDRCSDPSVPRALSVISPLTESIAT